MILKEYFKQLQEENQTMVHRQEEKTARLSACRLISFLVAFVMLVIGIVDHKMAVTIAGVIVLASFCVFVVWFQKEARRLAYGKAREQVLKRYLMRFQDGWHTFLETGEEYQKLEQPAGYEEEAYDLDLFGQASLYQYVNVAASGYGQDELAALLVAHLGDEKSVQEAVVVDKDVPEFYQIEHRQKAVEELIAKKEFSLHLETISQLYNMKQGNVKKVPFSTLKSNADGSNELEDGRIMQKVVLVITMLFLALTVSSLLFAVIGKVSYLAFGIMIVIQFCVSQFWDAILFSKTRKTFDYLRIISDYEPFLKSMLQQEYQSLLLNRMKETIGTDSIQAIQRLKTIGECLQIRHNPIVYGLLCGTCMYNAFVYLGYVRWNCRYGRKLSTWLRTTGKMEALLSLAVMGRVKEQYSFAKLTTEQDCYVELRRMTHPLICQEQAVANDVSLCRQIRIITGSNMSGKTTYLRTLGTNAVLAYAGAPVCAEWMQLSDMRIFTSMRVMDDVSHGISTFYAEVLRIKKMIAYSRQEKPMMALIDEIFKGTNSADRIVGAQGVITALCKPWVNAMVSTHDFELCSLAQQYDTIENYHFDEYFEEEKLLFDYTVKQGRCKTTNALHILRMAGIYEEARK